MIMIIIIIITYMKSLQTKYSEVFAPKGMK
jgi:hypothetical protein